MKKAIFLIILFLVPAVIAQADCNPTFDITADWKAFKEDNHTLISNYQSPNFREDDLLRIANLEIRNIGVCNPGKLKYVIQVTAPDNNVHTREIEVPELPPNQIYSLKYITNAAGNVTNTQGRFDIHEGPNKTGAYLYGIQLIHPGVWEVLGNLERAVPSDQKDVMTQRFLQFKVREKSDLLSEEQASTTIVLTRVTIIVTIILGLATILVQAWLTRWQISEERKHDNERHQREEDKQKAILDSILVLTGIAKEEMRGHEEELTRSVIPSYFISNIPSDFYITNINLTYNRKSTKLLKTKLVEARHKIENINRLISLAQETRGKIQKKIVYEIKDQDYKYHTHLEKILTVIDSELSSMGINAKVDKRA